MNQLHGKPWRAAGLGALVVTLAAVSDAGAADLRSPPVVPAPREFLPPVEARVYPYRYYWPDPGPASTSGYYGYYGTDIQGVPYYGLYSENVPCLRSAVTPDGYRVVDACRH